tara:strand:- start:247 stop:435 length:189 start_codon:yes stop_codon:yes gene_type:complete
MSKELVWTSDEEIVNNAGGHYFLVYNYLMNSPECTEEEAQEIFILLEFLENKIISFNDTIYQ